jgi:hypothetical protein
MRDQSELTQRPRRSRGELVLEMGFVLVFALSQVLAWVRLTEFSSQWEAISVGLLLGWLGADLLSGVVHFAADNLGSPATPLLGRTVISTFREHHHWPQKMLDHGFFERNGWNCGGAAALTLPMLAGNVFKPDVVIAAFLASGGLFLGMTNQIHAWAHTHQPPFWVTILQKCGVILAPRMHQHHHRREASKLVKPWSPNLAGHSSPDFAKRFTQGHYCITSGVWDRFFTWARLSPIDRQSSPTDEKLESS